ncbi:MAG: ATP-binding protein [Roseburia sp.]|nr:ATP-binding protein [Roseburia sp.]
MITNKDILSLYGNSNKQLIAELLNNSLFTEFANVCNPLNEKHTVYLKTILNLTSAITAYQTSGQRHNLFPEYSKHEIEHSYSVMYYMHKLLGNKEQVSCATYFYLIMVALCHDLGMTIINDDDMAAIKCNSYLCEQERKYNYKNVLNSVNNDDHNASSIIVRNSHHEREIIYKKVTYLFQQNKYDYSILNDTEWELIFKGCYSHGVSIDELKEIINRIPQTVIDGILRKKENGKFEGVNFALVCSLLRVCDLLDISYKRVGQYNTERNTNPYNLMNKFVEDVLIEEDNKLLYDDCISGNAGGCKCQRIEKYIKINFRECELKKIDDPDGDVDSRNLYETAYILLLQYFTQIEDELRNLKELLDFEIFVGPFTENIRPHVNERLKYSNEKYNYLKISIDEDGILNQLMSDKFYVSNDMAIRELLQNAIDACQAKALACNGYVPIINLSYYNNTLSIKDNGIGMTPDIIENFFLKAGKSLYKSNAYRYSNSQFFHAGQFGLGVFSVFMLTSQINVKTVHMKNTLHESCFTMKKNSRYARIETMLLQESKESGTQIEFKIDDNITLPDLESYIQRTFLRPSNIDLQILLNGKEIHLLTISDVELKQQYRLNLNRDMSISIDLQKYLNDVSGHLYLEKCPSSIWWYNSSTKEFDMDFRFDDGKEVAVISVFVQTSKNSSNKRVLFIIPWQDYFANTNQELDYTETVNNLEVLMDKDFSELCKKADIIGDKLSIKRFKTILSNKDNGNEVSGSGCDVTDNKFFYVNNIMITEKGDDFKISLPMDLPYRVSCLVMNIVNVDANKNREIKLLLNRNDFTDDTYKLILTAVRYAIFKYLSNAVDDCDKIDLSDRINELNCAGNFLIKMENK